MCVDKIKVTLVYARTLTLMVRIAAAALFIIIIIVAIVVGLPAQQAALQEVVEITATPSPTWTATATQDPGLLSTLAPTSALINLPQVAATEALLQGAAPLPASPIPTLEPLQPSFAIETPAPTLTVQATDLPLASPAFETPALPLDAALEATVTAIIADAALNVAAELVVTEMTETTMPAVSETTVPTPTADPLLVSSPATPLPLGTGSIGGQVNSLSRSVILVIASDASGAVAGSTTAAQDGSFVINGLVAGEYTLTIDDGISKVVRLTVRVGEGAATQLEQTTLIWGDVNRDGRIDELDVVTIAGLYGQPAPTSPVSLDINGDGIVGFSEFTLIADNYGR
jgi:hypothetical protein